MLDGFPEPLRVIDRDVGASVFEALLIEENQRNASFFGLCKGLFVYLRGHYGYAVDIAIHKATHTFAEAVRIVICMGKDHVDGLSSRKSLESINQFREAIEHLRLLGHRDIGFIAGPASLSSARCRRTAFQSALKHCGLTLHSDWIASGDLRVEGGRLAMHELLAGAAHPTAVVTTNDLMAVGALQAAHEAGVRIPEDISLVGFDDLPISTMVVPTLTTLQLSRREIAHHAFTSLMEAVRTRQKVLMQCPPVYPKLVIRQSSGKVREPHS